MVRLTKSASTSGVMGVVQPLEDVLVPRGVSRPLCKLLSNAKSSLAEILLQPQPPAVLGELLAPGVEACDGGQGPLVNPDQVPLVRALLETGLQYSR